MDFKWTEAILVPSDSVCALDAIRFVHLIVRLLVVFVFVFLVTQELATGLT